MINYFDGKSAATGQNARRESTMTPRNTTPVYKRHISAATTSSKKKCSKLKRNLPPQGGASQRKILKNQKLSTTLPAPPPLPVQKFRQGSRNFQKNCHRIQPPAPNSEASSQGQQLRVQSRPNSNCQWREYSHQWRSRSKLTWAKEK